MGHEKKSKLDDTTTIKEPHFTGAPHVSTPTKALANDIFSIGAVIGDRYRVVSLIGRGGMGCIYEVMQLAGQKSQAMKVLFSHASSDGALRRFQQEAQALRKLEHPNIVKATDCGVLQDGQPFFVMDLVHGETLSYNLEAHGAWDTHEAVRLFSSLADALECAHKQGVVHRDIKPSNVMLERSSSPQDTYTPKIVDFGIAKFGQGIGQQSITRTGEIFGSPIYMSPEQCLGEKVDHRCDIYSLGCALFHTLTGCPPFVGDNALSTMILHRSKNPPTLKESSLGRDYPQSLEDLIARCLEKDVNKRFQTMSELKSALAHCLDAHAKTGKTLVRASGGVAGSRETSAQPEESKAKWSARYFFIGTGILLVALGSIAAAMNLLAPTEPSSKSGQVRSYLPEQKSAGGAGGSLEEHPPAVSAPSAHVRSSADKPGPQEANANDRTPDYGRFRLAAERGATNIDASGCDIQDRDLPILLMDRRLSDLSLNHTPVSNAGLTTIGRLDTLHVLYLDHTEISNTGLASLLPLKDLRTLHISENRLDNDCTATLGQMGNLSELHMRDALIDDTGLKRLSRLHSLHSLQVNKSLITDDGVKIIVDSFPQLVELHARYVKGITKKSLQYLSQAPKLRKLTLVGCSIDTEDMRTFFKAHPRIKEISSTVEGMILQFTDTDSRR